MLLSSKYATKLAATTELFFQLAQSQLHYSATRLAKNFDNAELRQDEVNRLREQTASFNPVAIVDANGYVKTISPESLMLQGMQLTSSSVVTAPRFTCWTAIIRCSITRTVKG